MSPSDQPIGNIDMAVFNLIFPSNPVPQEEVKLSYNSLDVSDILNTLNSKLEEATNVKDELIDAKYNIEESLGDLETYVDDLENLIGSLGEIPELDITVEVDIAFDSSN